MIDDADLAKNVLLEVKARLQMAETAESDNRSEALDDLTFEDGEQWDQVVAGQRQDRPRPVINHLATFVRRVVNGLKQQRPRIKVHPTGGGSRVQDAEVIEGLIRHIENRSTASIAYDTAGESAVKIGWGYFRIQTEYADDGSFNNQEICISPIRNTFTVYIDPSAVKPAGDDARWYILTGMMKRDTYKALYPKAENAEFTYTTTGDSEHSWETKEDIRLAEYYRITQKSERYFRLIDGTGAYESEFENDDDRKFIAKDVTGKPISRMRIKDRVEWFKINGDAVVDHRELPGSHIPIIRCEGNVLDVNGRVKRKGMIRDIKDPQRSYNWSAACKLERLALTPKASWIGYKDVIEGHNEWFTANTANHSILLGEAVQGPNGETLPLPTRTPPAPVEAGFEEALRTAEHDLVAIAGMPNEPAQDKRGEVISGEAIQQRQKIADINHYQYYDKQTLAIQLCGRILLDYIQVYYDTPRMQRIIGNDGMPKMVQINQPVQTVDDVTGETINTVKNDLTVGKFDVVMDVGPGYETKRQEGAAAILALVDTPELGKKIADVGADIVVRNLDFNGSDDLADRLAVTTPQGMESMMEDLPKQAQTVVKSLQTQLQASQAKIQSLEADLKYGLTKTLHQEATKLQVENLRDHRAERDTRTDTFTKVEDTHTRARTAITVAEINAASKEIDTHVQGHYDAQARHDELEAAERAERVN
jgi:hypothetical protein